MDDPVLDPLHGPSSRICEQNRGLAGSLFRSHSTTWTGMPETEGLAWKQKIRAAHRGSVTRIIGQVYENLESRDGPNLPRLKQYKVLLSGKLEVLSKLDDELIELVGVEDLDSEVEQADVIREKIRLCILDIDQAIERADSIGATPRGSSSVVTPPAGGGPHPPGSPTDTTPPATEEGTPVVPITSTIVRTPPTTGLTTPTSGGDALATTHLSTTPHVKFPKLSIKKFNGDLTKWVTFWDSFDSSVHRNLSLSNVDKFNYLNSFLESTAAESIAGLTLTSANYEEAVATLKRRFAS